MNPEDWGLYMLTLEESWGLSVPRELGTAYAGPGEVQGSGCTLRAVYVGLRGGCFLFSAHLLVTPGGLDQL